MNQIQQIPIRNKTSQLERFALGFEYDKTIQELKREMQVKSSFK